MSSCGWEKKNFINLRQNVLLVSIWKCKHRNKNRKEAHTVQVQFEKIPQFLKDNGQFCCWQYELRDGDKTKVPYTPGTTRRANVKIPTTFTAFEAAASATGYEGIGIRVHGRIVGIDLDHCIVEGKLLPWAQEIVDRFGATYIEVSPSGTGIRIFCLLPDGFTYDTQTYYIKKGDIEVYIPGHTNRFLTVTGNALTETDVAETAEALLWLLDTYMRRPTPPTPAVTVPGESYLSDEEVIAKASAAKNGEKFRRLWDGDITGYPHPTATQSNPSARCGLRRWCLTISGSTPKTALPLTTSISVAHAAARH